MIKLRDLIVERKKANMNLYKKVVKALKDIKINYLTVHISSGLAALKAVKKISGPTRIVGVTTLTSLNNNDLKTEILYETQGCLLNNILGVLSVPSYLVRPNGLLNLLPPCVHGKASR